MGIQSSRNNSDRCLILCILIVHRTEDDIGIVACKLLYIAGCVICLDQADIAGNIDDNVACTLDGCLKQRAGYSLLNSLKCLVITLCMTDTDMSDTLVHHNGLNICKVKIDKTRNIDQVGNTLYCLLKNLICFLQCIRHRGTAVYDLKKFIIRDNNQSIDSCFQFFDTIERVAHTGLCLETERLCDNADRQDAHIFCDTCNNRSCTCTGTAAHTCGNEYHICTLESLCQLFLAFLSCFLTDLRLCACTKSLGQLLTNLHSCGRLAELQCLLICIDTDKFYTGNIFIDHAVDSVVTGSADTYYYNSGRVLCFIYLYL